MNSKISFWLAIVIVLIWMALSGMAGYLLGLEANRSELIDANYNDFLETEAELMQRRIVFFTETAEMILLTKTAIYMSTTNQTAHATPQP